MRTIISWAAMQGFQLNQCYHTQPLIVLLYRSKERKSCSWAAGAGMGSAEIAFCDNIPSLKLLHFAQVVTSSQLSDAEMSSLINDAITAKLRYII
jgi:hypothetical protein